MVIKIICRILTFTFYSSAKEKRTAKLNERENPTLSTAAFTLLLPGRVLDISALNSQHKFRDRGKKQGAVEAIEHLEEAGLGVVQKERATRGTAMVSTLYSDNKIYTSITKFVCYN